MFTALHAVMESQVEEQLEDKQEPTLQEVTSDNSKFIDRHIVRFD